MTYTTCDGTQVECGFCSDFGECPDCWGDGCEDCGDTGVCECKRDGQPRIDPPAMAEAKKRWPELWT